MSYCYVLSPQSYKEVFGSSSPISALDWFISPILPPRFDHPHFHVEPVKSSSLPIPPTSSSPTTHYSIRRSSTSPKPHKIGRPQPKVTPPFTLSTSPSESINTPYTNADAEADSNDADVLSIHSIPSTSNETIKPSKLSPSPSPSPSPSLHTRVSQTKLQKSHSLPTPKPTPLSSFENEGGSYQENLTESPSAFTAKNVRFQLEPQPPTPSARQVAKMNAKNLKGKLKGMDVPMDVYENSTSHTFYLPLPGVTTSSLSISLTSPSDLYKVLEISGEFPSLPEDSQDFQIRVKSRPVGKFLKRIKVLSQTQPSDIKAKMTDGLLRVQVKKKSRSLPSSSSKNNVVAVA